MSIPDETLKTAESVYAKLGRGSRPDTDTIARALMAERERAARIAENDDHFPQEGEHIAAAIRNA